MMSSSQLISSPENLEKKLLRFSLEGPIAVRQFFVDCMEVLSFETGGELG
jgi:hypothetical protein